MLRSTLLALVSGTLLFAQTSIQQKNGSFEITVEDKPFATFNTTKGPKPYFHPLRSAFGFVVSDDRPSDHPHHRGLWFSHGDVNGWDFWANEPEQKGVGKGKGLIRTKSASAEGDTITAQFEWVDGEGKVLLTEDRKMRILGDDSNRFIDFDITLTAVDQVKFGDTKEGAFAVRLVAALTETRGGALMTNAEGAASMKAVWGKPSPWVDYRGATGGRTLGVAIIDHPKNPRYPTRWHARDYGLFAANIFGLHDFENDKTKDGSMSLKPGEKVRFRYWFVIHSGDTPIRMLSDDYAGR